MTAPTPDLDYDTIWEAGRAEGYEAGRDEFAHTLAAVTAERDQALEALAATNKLGAFETGKTIGAAEVRKELDQARQMLADAPHMENCCWDSAIQPRCTCWKAGL